MVEPLQVGVSFLSGHEEVDAVAEARRILAEADSRGILLRLLGGVAFKLRCSNLARRTADIDLAGLAGERNRIERLLVDLGYSAGFNAIRWERLIFYDSENNRRLDVFLDVFEMSHKVPLKGRLALDAKTLPLADLLLTKLQVYEFTEREYLDVFALLKEYDLSTSESRLSINGRYVAKLCGRDWGLYRTLTLNLERLESHLSEFVTSESDRTLISARISKLKDTVDSEPKSLKWKMRSTIGERVRWYELPEEMRTSV